MHWIVIVVLLLPTIALGGPCPASFDDFLSRFETSREFQQAQMLYPLPFSFVDSQADPEPKTVHKSLSPSDVVTRKKAIYPSPAEQKSASLVREIKGQAQAKKVIRLYKPDTGHLLEYTFENIGGCWKLSAFDDRSI